ncbi:hypothetical protein KP509_21G087000 [Ceratopteris richardii]|uniref:LysM domain-containing protein n=1 Tax=Ceratopteris richardii TaxID=49495 RepID=A0A8T2SE94_CERRI|nr:hypothetical protein KP509_21G087000 [Ceratopteris richardii]
MMKGNENEFERAALQESLQFWRWESKPSSPQSFTSSSLNHSPVSLPSTSATIPGIPDSGPRPWRYIRWRKAHARLPQMVREHSDIGRGNFYHRVLPDEDLVEVAEKFTTYPEVLMEANRILNPINVATGQLLWVPRTHPIEWGNTLWSLSLKYNVPISTIQKANGIVDPDLIYAGDVLVVPEEEDNRNAW